MITVSAEWRDEVDGVVIKGIVLRDGEEKVLLDVFFLGTPDLLTAFVDNGVLMRVVGNGGGTRWGGKKMGEEFSFQGIREWEVGKDRSRWGGGGDDGDGSFDDRQREVLDGDISERDMLDYFLKLKVDIGVLVFGGWVLELRAYNVSLLGSNVGEDVKEVGWGSDNGGQGWGAIGIGAHGGAITS
jgi:hypothetical protein